MADKSEIVSDYRRNLVRDLGVWADDPRSMAAVDARTQRAMETMAHMDRPLPRESQVTDMQPGTQYSLK